MKILGELDDKGRERFQREIMAAIAVSDQPNVVKILDTGVYGKRPYIVSEVVDGHSLAAELAERGRMDPGRARELIIQVTEAVASLHKRSLIHRDLKPDNILIRESDGQALLTDFGLARALNADTLTQSGDWAGTPQYMSPEQFDGSGDQIDERSDIWALGAIIYEMLSSKPPFPSEDLSSLVTAVLGHEPRGLSSLRPELPKAWDSIVKRCLCKSREGRFASATQLLQALQTLTSLEPVQARPPGLLKRIWHSLARRLGWALAALLLFFLSAAPLALLASLSLRRSRLRHEALLARARELTRPLGQEPLSPAEMTTVVCQVLLPQCKGLEELVVGDDLDRSKQSPKIHGILNANRAIAEALSGTDGPELKAIIAAETPDFRRQILTLEELTKSDSDAGALAEFNGDWRELLSGLRALRSPGSPNPLLISALESLNSKGQSAELRELARLGLIISMLRSKTMAGLAEHIVELPQDAETAESAREILEPYYVGLIFSRLAECPLSDRINAAEDDLIASLHMIFPARSPSAGLIRQGYARLLRKFEGARAYEVFRVLHQPMLLKTWGLPALTASELFTLAESASKQAAGLGDALELFAVARQLGCERLTPPDFRSQAFQPLFRDRVRLGKDSSLAHRVFDAMLALTRAGEPIEVEASVLAVFEDAEFFALAAQRDGERDPAFCFWRGSLDARPLEERYEASKGTDKSLLKSLVKRIERKAKDLELVLESELAASYRARAALELAAAQQMASRLTGAPRASRSQLMTWIETAIRLGLPRPDEAWRTLWSLLPRAEVEARRPFTASFREVILARHKLGSSERPATGSSTVLQAINDEELEGLMNRWRAMRADDELALGQPGVALPLAREAWIRDPGNEDIALLYTEALLAEQESSELEIFLEKSKDQPYSQSPRFLKLIEDASK